MIFSKAGAVEFVGDYPSILADLLLIMDEFTEMTNDLEEQDDRIEPMIKDAFETFPSTVINFTKIFVQATH